jgi:hypothetical protein
MNPVAGMMILLAAVAGTGTMMWIIASLHARIKQLEQGGGADTEALSAQVEVLRQELLATRDEVAELYERVEFAERMLARGKSDRALGGGGDA